MMANGPIDIEKGAADAETYLIALEFQDKQIDQHSFKASLKTKMHFRYPPPSEESYTTYKMLPPLAFIECADYTLASLKENPDYYKEVVHRQSFLERILYSRSRLRWYALRTGVSLENSDSVTLPNAKKSEGPVVFAGTMGAIALMGLSFLYLICKAMKGGAAPSDPKKED